MEVGLYHTVAALAQPGIEALRLRQENGKFQAFLCYTENSIPAWATQWDPVSKIKRQGWENSWLVSIHGVPSSVQNTPSPTQTQAGGQQSAFSGSQRSVKGTTLEKKLSAFDSKQYKEGEHPSDQILEKMFWWFSELSRNSYKAQQHFSTVALIGEKIWTTATEWYLDITWIKTI